MPALTVQQLFTPAPSGVGPSGNVPTTPPQGSWLANMLSVAARVQLPTTSWQPGAPERTILAVQAVSFAETDVNVAIMAQGGFLQSAASGTVTYTTTDGTTITVPVTPDPSNAAQNPTGAPGWLDLLTQNVYDVTRLAATPAAGPLAIANLKGSSIGPYVVGAYHAANTASGATYHNTASLTVPSSIIAGSGGSVTACTPGLTLTSITTGGPHGVVAGQTVYVVMPPSTGITGLNGVFAIATAVTTTILVLAIGSSGTFTGGGNVYLCTVASMAADVAGIASNAGPGAVTTAITQNANVFVGNVQAWSGSNWESNTALATRSQLSLASRSPNGPSQAYVYFAETAYQLLADAVPSYTLVYGPVVANSFSSPLSGIVTTVVASANPASTTLGAAVTPGCAQDPITGVTNANPAVITCSGPTGMTASLPTMTVTISGVLGVSGPNITVNGTFIATYVSADSFSIPVNTSTASAYGGGGQVEGGDLGAIDALLQQNVVPDNTTAVTVSALAMPITVTATVVVPQAYVSTYRVAVLQQLQAQISVYPIGGSSSSSPANSVPWDDILGALEEAGVITLGSASIVRSVQSLSITDGSTTVSTSGTGISFPGPYYQAVLMPPSITVLGV